MMLRRPKLYSRQGCVSCKQRKKKCDERKPTCGPCKRLNLHCDYSTDGQVVQKTRGAVDLGPVLLHLASPTYQAQAINTHEINDGTEEGILHEIPKTLPMFWASTSSASAQDMQVLHQMTAQHMLVRDALVACFSGFLGHSDDLSRVKHRALGRSLCMLRTKLAKSEHDSEDIMQVKLAMNFIGMMEALSPGPDVDLLEHWRGVIAYKDQPYHHGRAQLPWKEHLLCQESLLFHTSILAIFSQHSKYVHTLRWKSPDHICSDLDSLNPEGPDRVSNSPLLSGQYELFTMALRVTHLLRSSSLDEADVTHDGDTRATREDMNDSSLDKLMAIVSAKQQTLDSDLGLLPPPSSSSTSSSSAPQAQAPDSAVPALCQAHHLLCNALQICILALYAVHAGDPQECIRSIASLVSQSLRGFARMRGLLEAGDPARSAHVLWMALWPFQILACATSKKEDLEGLAEAFKTLGGFMDEGSRVRTEALFGRIRKAGSQAEREEEEEVVVGKGLPAGLGLLRKKKGVLS